LFSHQPPRQDPPGCVFTLALPVPLMRCSMSSFKTKPKPRSGKLGYHFSPVYECFKARNGMFVEQVVKESTRTHPLHICIRNSINIQKLRIYMRVPLIFNFTMSFPFLCHSEVHDTTLLQYREMCKVVLALQIFHQGYNFTLEIIQNQQNMTGFQY